jgi:hypothetical protein
LACTSSKLSKVPDEAKHNLKGSTHRHIGILIPHNISDMFITCHHTKLHTQATLLRPYNEIIYRPFATTVSQLKIYDFSGDKGFLK